MDIPIITLNNGTQIPQIGLGVFQIPDDEVTDVVTTALDIGYRSIDTAAIYKNETGVGRAIADSGIPRHELSVTSKVWITDYGYEQTLRAYDASLARLGLDYLDLYLVHWPAPASDDYLETWRALEKLAADGRVKAIGVSNFLPEHFQRVVDNYATVPAVNQIEIHPAHQQRAVITFAESHGTVIEAWSPLAQGAALHEPLILDIAQRINRTPAQVILRWNMQSGRIVIPKSITPSRLRENLDILDFALTGADLAAIDGLEQGGRIGPDPATFQG